MQTHNIPPDVSDIIIRTVQRAYKGEVTLIYDDTTRLAEGRDLPPDDPAFKTSRCSQVDDDLHIEIIPTTMDIQGLRIVQFIFTFTLGAERLVGGIFAVSAHPQSKWLVHRPPTYYDLMDAGGHLIPRLKVLNPENLSFGNCDPSRS